MVIRGWMKMIFHVEATIIEHRTSKEFLVGGLEHDFYDFPCIGNVIIPTDELIFFRGVETTNQI
jgi:hypothetical protein